MLKPLPAQTRVGLSSLCGAGRRFARSTGMHQSRIAIDVHRLRARGMMCQQVSKVALRYRRPLWPLPLPPHLNQAADAVPSHCGHAATGLGTSMQQSTACICEHRPAAAAVARPWLLSLWKPAPRLNWREAALAVPGPALCLACARGQAGLQGHACRAANWGRRSHAWQSRRSRLFDFRGVAAPWAAPWHRWFPGPLPPSLAAKQSG